MRVFFWYFSFDFIMSYWRSNLVNDDGGGDDDDDDDIRRRTFVDN